MRFMECTLSGRGKTPQQGVTLSRSVLRIAGDGHVEGAGGGSSPRISPAIGAHEREETGAAARRRAAAPSARGLASPHPGTAAALDAPNRSSLTPADA
jgi:hypothetical protein